MLNALGANCVINAAAELPDTPLDDSDVIYCKIPVTDSSYEDIRQYFDSTADLIHKVSILRLINECNTVACLANFKIY